ncbi:MAG: hypothetical protein LZF62_140041 [Nitrospira sp.]|nr:MAG: hypothetical protein LZF62_140041 [Nitrospira sp.]
MMGVRMLDRRSLRGWVLIREVSVQVNDAQAYRIVKMAVQQDLSECRGEAYPRGTLRLLTMREQGWRAFAPSCYRSMKRLPPFSM